jgi:preprotein translocase subunit SecE
VIGQRRGKALKWLKRCSERRSRSATSRFNRSAHMIAKTKNFFNEVKVELQKASWPWDPKEKGFRKYKELTDSTLVVVIAMLLLGGYVALFDFVLVNVVHYFTRLH